MVRIIKVAGGQLKDVNRPERARCRGHFSCHWLMSYEIQSTFVSIYVCIYTCTDHKQRAESPSPSGNSSCILLFQLSLSFTLNCIIRVFDQAISKVSFFPQADLYECKNSSVSLIFSQVLLCNFLNQTSSWEA